MAGHFAEWLVALGPGIANHLWQSTAFLVAAWLVTLALRNHRARVRHALWLAASVKFLVPFSLLIVAGNLLPHPKQAVAPVVYSAMDVVEEPFAGVAPPAVAPPVQVPTLRERIAAALPLSLGVLWLAGAGVVLVAFAIQGRKVRRTLQEAEPACAGREFEILRRLEARFAGTRRTRPLALRMSPERMEPGIFGILRPALVWPRELSTRLDDEHIEAVLAHELMHVRRRDNLTAALHMLVETVFWFHPLVWWMERQMVKEREQACDEAVVEMVCGAQPGDAETWSQIYAESLLKTCRFCIESPLACVAGVTGGELKQRVVGIVTGRALLRMTWPKKLLLAAAAVCVVAAPVVLGQAKAAQRMMLAAIDSAPKPFRMAARATIPGIETSSTGMTAEMQAPAGVMPVAPAQVAAQAAGPLQSFSVAAVRPDPSTAGSYFRYLPGGRLSASSWIKQVIEIVYGLKDYQVTGGPGWLTSQWYDIEAKADNPDASKGDINAMTQTLLADRFKLKFHMETKEFDVYDLVVDKNGPKLTPLKEGEDFHCTTENTEICGISNPTQLATWLNHFVDKPVLDKTGISGRYEMLITFDVYSARGQTPPENYNKPLLQDALRDQLGLRLVPHKEPMPVLVIDHIEKPTSVDGAEVPQANSAPAAMAQEKSPPPTQRDYRFEVASIRPDVLTSFQAGDARLRPQYSPGLYRETATPLSALVGEAFGIKHSYQMEFPQWMNTEYFTLNATPPEGSTRADIPIMLRHLLEDRFGLKFHHESRQVGGYELVVAKSGARLTKSPAPASERHLLHGGAGLDFTKQPPRFIENAGSGFLLGGSPPTAYWRGRNETMEVLAAGLAGRLNVPVMDATGLEGEYDYDLIFTPEVYRGPASNIVSPLPPPASPNPAAGEAAASTPPEHPELRDALQEQLGLKLQAVKNVPVDVVVIDSANKEPSPN